MKVRDFLDVNGNDTYVVLCWETEFEYKREAIESSMLIEKDIYEIKCLKNKIVIVLNDEAF